MQTVSTISKRLTADSVRRAAIERLGVADAMVTRYTDQQRRIFTGDGDEAMTDCVGGVWYVLSVQPRPGDDWQIVARRRTLGELMEWITR